MATAKVGDGNGGGNGGRKGPPDLDEALRKFQDRINRLVGGKKRSGGSGGDSFGSGGGKGLLLLGVLLVGALWLYNAVYVVDEQEQPVPPGRPAPPDLLVPRASQDRRRCPPWSHASGSAPAGPSTGGAESASWAPWRSPQPPSHRG